jgi:hypothetical protein
MGNPDLTSSDGEARGDRQGGEDVFSPAETTTKKAALSSAQVPPGLSALAIALPHWTVGTFAQAGLGEALELQWVDGEPPSTVALQWLETFLGSEAAVVLALMAEDMALEEALPSLLPLPYPGVEKIYSVSGAENIASHLRQQGTGNLAGLLVVGDRSLTAPETLCFRQQGALMFSPERSGPDPLGPCRAMAHQIQTPLSLLELYTTLLEQAPDTCAPNVMQTLGQAIQQIQDTLTRAVVKQ